MSFTPIINQYRTTQNYQQNKYNSIEGIEMRRKKRTQRLKNENKEFKKNTRQRKYPFQLKPSFQNLVFLFQKEKLKN